jgi:Uma2 family endonuclease
MTAPAIPYTIPPTLLPNLLRITADQYHTMIDDGIIPNGAPYELLDGYIVHKDRARLGGNPLSHDPIHVLAIKLLTRLASRFDQKSCHLQLQLPIALSPLYEPEPDGAIIRGTPEDYRTRLATAADVSCIIEAAHSSLARDAETKLAAYAAAGIPQYVILNLQSNSILVHSDPDPGAATYRTKTTATTGQSLALLLPDNQRLTVPAADILP